MSHYVNLNIVVPEAFILGSGEHHVDTGSVISLVCIIEKVNFQYINIKKEVILFLNFMLKPCFLRRICRGICIFYCVNSFRFERKFGLILPSEKTITF